MRPIKLALCMFMITALVESVSAQPHPRLLLSPDSAQLIIDTLDPASGFGQALAASKAKTEKYFETFPDVPVPVDPGGGYTHEKHKKNGVAIHDAGIVYQLTKDPVFAHHARDLLLAYAQLYPSLGRHPVRRSNVPGRMFWQSLNEAVWLVYAIQGYDAIYETLTSEQREVIENGVLRPLADFISDESPETFDRIHNHGTWAVAAVGMTGYVLGDTAYVKKALYGLAGDGKSGFMRQLDLLFSPDGYYTEGPYYQRYALMPFVLFARVIEANEPSMKIFEYRNNVLLKAIYACIDLSYAGLFFPLNDAIKDKGLDTVELRYGIAVAYALSNDPKLLSIASIQHPFVLTGDGYKLSKALDEGLGEPYQYRSMRFGDGPEGNQGALVVLRDGSGADQQALVFKPTSQGMGHGHFDKLHWLFYDNGREIVSDYGAARFLNVVQKNGGVYLPENTTWAKQTVAHNTLVVDQGSHFGGDPKLAQRRYPEVMIFDTDNGHQVTAASMVGAYPDVQFSRTMALLRGIVPNQSIVVDVLKAKGQKPHQYDLPLHFDGQIIASSPALKANTDELRPLGNANGYQHLWSRAQVSVEASELMTLTWLTDNRFYTYTALADDGMEVFMTELGANDPDFNLRRQQALILRADNVAEQSFISVLEPHGEYNGPAEYTNRSSGSIKNLQRFNEQGADLIRITTAAGEHHYLGLSYDGSADAMHTVSADGRVFSWPGYWALFDQNGLRQ